MNQSKVVAIVPAYNEERTVGKVVEVLVASACFDEVVVVSDGSTDDTAKVAAASGARVLTSGKKSGKGAALAFGVQETTAPLLAFFDADLLNLSLKHIEDLLAPVVSGEKAMFVGLHDRGVLNPFLRYLPLIGGERVMRREVFEGVPSRFLQGFAVESALNYYCRSHGLPYGSVILSGLTMRKKYQKVGWPRGMWQYLKMSGEVVVAMISVRTAKLFNKF